MTTNEYWKAKESKCEQSAKAFFEKKEKKNYYSVSGSPAYEDDDMPRAYYHWFTDEDKEKIKELIVSVYNAEYATEPTDLPAYSYKDVCENGSLGDLRSVNRELDELLFDNFWDECDMLVEDIDFENSSHLYQFLCRGYYEREKRMLPPESFKVPLTDEEYIYLLTQKLMHGEMFNFNRLIQTNPQLAQKINGKAEFCYTDGIGPNGKLMMIEMVEVNNDIELIEGEK